MFQTGVQVYTRTPVDLYNCTGHTFITDYTQYLKIYKTTIKNTFENIDTRVPVLCTFTTFLFISLEKLLVVGK